MNRVVVVGASAGGLATAESLRRLGFSGDLTLVGAEASPPYDRPPLSKQILTGELTAAQVELRSAEQLDELALDLRLGVEATGVDLATRRLSTTKGAIGYDALVVATGVRPRSLPGATGASGVHFVRTLDDALGLKESLQPGQRLVVVGAGFIGAETAAVARSLGVEVTMLEPEPVPLARALGEQVGLAFGALHREHGVDLRTEVAVREILNDGSRVTGVRTAEGGVVPADAVVVGIGSVPNVEWLQGSGLSLGDGLLCDEFSRAAPDVYGVGDVARWTNPLFGVSMRIEHRTNAAEQGLAVARNLLEPGAGKPFAPVPYFWSDQYDRKLQAYGYLRDHDEIAVVAGDLRSPSFVAAYRKGEVLTGVVAGNAGPKVLRGWRAAIARQQPWRDVEAGPGQLDARSGGAGAARTGGAQLRTVDRMQRPGVF
ncbi:FAD-dependent oxidoreductase [Kribbella sp. ALI-6-A]|uniref:NAD(P)/FAD-dependent oxidoreductase n=1 Tax=Kribbella sp. ALI-6-A TaxID=1933817 RepID=UPI00097CBA9A|nr:FAD-dependent oxidoreductase [Kribbella sp. ALI-6-A]ONI78328.1 FAD-dependent oxidoreductase [Kribbella sp. ALI-6-A]